MAPSLHYCHYYFLVALLPFFLLPHIATATSHRRHGGLKSLHFTLFQHETINKTLYVITSGVVGTNVSETTTPFGTLFVFEDPLTLTSNSTSKVVGTAEGISMTSSHDGLRTISTTKVTLRMKKHKGSVSIVGGPHNVNPSDQPIVGGTGDFMFVQGYVRTSPVQFSGLTYVYKFQLHIYWPPYAY